MDFHYILNPPPLVLVDNGNRRRMDRKMQKIVYTVVKVVSGVAERVRSA